MNILLRRDEATETIIYTDGSAFTNPSRGGYASVIVQGAHQERISGGFLQTTSMRMELMAAVAALERLTAPCRVRLLTDCRVLQRAVEQNYFLRSERMGWIISTISLCRTVICGGGCESAWANTR